MKFFNRLFATQAIQIRNGKCSVAKGKLKPSTLREVKLLCSDIGIHHGEIWINPVGKLSFSSKIPSKNHQQFRNVFAST